MQPRGGFTRSGGRPAIASSFEWLGCASFGIDFSNASVYGWRVFSNSERVGALLDDAAGVHHRDVVGASGDDAEVVRDQHHRHEPFALLLLQEVEDLRLHGDVERGGRFVGEQELRTARQRDGDHDALAHAARELVRILPQPALGFGNPDRGEQGQRGLLRVVLGDVEVEPQRLRDLVADRA